MANIYPSQERYLDPYSTYFSDNVNKITRLVTKRKNCLLSNNSITVENDPDYPKTKLIVRSGSFVKDDVVIEFLEDISVDMENRDFYISGDPFNEAGTYYLVIDYTYQRAKPPVQASIVILKPSQYYWLDNRFLFLKAISVIFNGSTFEISNLYDYDLEPPYALSSNTAMYLPMIEGSGSTCFDSIGSFDGTIHGSVWTERNMYFKKVLKFDGSDSNYIQLNNDIITLLDPFTVTMFFRFDSGDSDPCIRRIITLVNGINSFEFGVHTSERRFAGRINDTPFSSETGILDPNTWYFVAVSVDSSSINIYYSSSFSEIFSATTEASGITPNPISSSIGGGLNNYHWLGSICEVRVLNIAITSDQAMRLMKQPWLVEHAKINYTETYSSFESKLPIFDSLLDIGKILYVKKPGVAYIGKEEGWTEFGVLDYTCDTSHCTLHQLAYIGAGNVAYPAIADSSQHFASCFVTKVDAIDGRVRLSGKVFNGLVESGITISPGDPLFLSSSEAGKVTNIDPHVNTQLIGICISSSGSDYETILSPLSGGNGVSTHNLMNGLEGGGDGHYYHLNLTDYTGLTSFGGNHNNILYGLQGGTSTQRYHLSLSQYNAINAFGGNHNNIPYGLQGGSSTERYHLNSTNYTALTAFGGNHNNCSSGLQGGNSTERYHLTASEASAVASFGGNHNSIPYGLQGGNSTERYHLTADEYNNLLSNLSVDANINALKSYIISLLNYNEDIYNIKDKDPYVTEQNIGKTPIGDVISGNKISTIATSYDTYGIFDSFIGSSWTTTGNLLEEKAHMGSFSLSKDIGIIAGGQNYSSIAISTCDSYNVSTGIWTSRTSLSPTRARYGISSFTFSSELGLISAGFMSDYSNYSDLYNFTANTWTAKSNISYLFTYASSFSLTNDIGISAGGRNGPGYSYNYISTCSKYSLSANSWTILGCSLIYPKALPASLTLTWDTGLSSGGENSSYLSSSEKLSLSGSIWTSRTSLSFARSGSSGISTHSNFGVISGGSNSSDYLENTDRYNDAFNIWEGLESIPIPKRYASGISFNSISGIVAGGSNGSVLNSVNYFKDSTILTDLSDKKFIMTDSSEITPVHHKDKVILDTIRLTNTTQEIRKLIISGIYKKQSTSSEIGVDISLDDGSTWGNGYLDSIIDVSSLSHSGSNYYLRLNFNINQNDNADTWTNVSEMIAKRAIAAFGLSNYEGLSAGGQNSTGLSSCQKFDNNTTSWTSRAAMLSSRYFAYGFQIKRSIGIVACDYSPSSVADIYKDVNNIWVSTNNLNMSRTDPGGFRLNDNFGIIAGGNNSVVCLTETERFSSSSYSWVMVNDISIGRNGGAGISLTADSALLAGGTNGSYPPSYGYSEKYFNSMNTWVNRNQLPIAVDDLAEISLTPNYGLVACGYNSNYIKTVQMYNDSGNIWTFRKNYPETKSACGGISLTSEMGIVCAGEIAPSTYTGSSARYNYGETSFIGFSTLLFS